MSLNNNSLFLQDASPLNPLDLYTSYSSGDLELLYDFPSQSSLDDSGPQDMYGGCCEGSNLNCLDQNWLTEPVSLPSLEEQDSEIKVSSPSSLPFTPYQYSSIPVNVSASSNLIADVSLPFTHLSTEEEIIAPFDEDRTVTANPMPFNDNTILPPMSPQQQIIDSTSSCLTSTPYVSEGSNTGDKSLKRKSSPIKRSLSKAEKKRKQNKAAADRYRRKEKEKRLVMEVRQRELEDKNSILKAQVTSLSNEINIIRSLVQSALEKS